MNKIGWVGVGCVQGSCDRGARLIPFDGPDEPGWVYVEGEGWACPRHAWIADMLPYDVAGPEPENVSRGRADAEAAR